MDSDNDVIPAKVTCGSCGAALKPNSRFCNICGGHQSGVNLKELESRWPLFKQAALFYAICIISCALPKYINYFDTTFWDFFFEVFLWANIIAFFAINWEENKKLLSWENFSWQKLCAYLSITITGALIVHYAMGWLNVVIFPGNEFFEQSKGGLFYGAFLIFFTAVTPAVFEELGFRGYLMQNLLKISDTQQAIYVTAFLFAILHLQIIGLVWLLPLAVFLGYIRVKENTLWYGIFIHFAFNLTACIFQLF